MNKVSPLILLAGVLLLTACSEHSNSNSKQQVSSTATNLGDTSNVGSKMVPAIFVEQPEPVVVPEPVKPVAAKPTPAVASSFKMSEKEAKRFNNFDANGDGGVTLSECTEALSRHFEKTSSDKDASAIAAKRMDQLDLNRDGSLSAEEFTTKRK